MTETSAVFTPIHSNSISSTNSDELDSISTGSVSPRSMSPFYGWSIRYVILPKSPEAKGIWDGYQTKEEFLMMHLR